MNQPPSIPAPLPLRRGKRLLDLCLGLLALLPALPLMLVICLAMLLEMLLDSRSRGPLIYREPRVSRGKVFSILKFRTVRLANLEAWKQEGRFKTVKELELEPGNLTRCGRVLRQWYLDELPQLINIIRGEMSLVGPRPWPLEDHLNTLRSGYNIKGSVPCGLAGLVQCHKGVPSNDLQLDLEYIEAYRTLSSWQLLLYDLRILWQSLLVLLQGKGI